ncbi:MAG TPA: polymer-forming cytoskeletal protein [Vicinamibacteria bacterium]|nr:polymer-forming cytoskeletal protein [Vicinamibacteria bacterium]
MWNKREEESVRPPVAPAGGSPSGVSARREAAAIGPSISIVGDVTGEEDLTILGRVKGKVDLPQHSVTVGESGRVDADIRGRIVSVAGEVHGNLLAGEQILIRKTATMLGNLTAPRVGLEDGCRFRGTVDMETQAEKGRPAPAPTVRAHVVPKPADAGLPTEGPGGGVATTKPEGTLTRL